VRDGDPITIDVDARRVDLDVSADVLDARRSEPLPTTPGEDGAGWLAVYKQLVSTVREGAVLTRRETAP